MVQLIGLKAIAEAVVTKAKRVRRLAMTFVGFMGADGVTQIDLYLQPVTCDNLRYHKLFVQLSETNAV